jgi:hypothetical protein
MLFEDKDLVYLDYLCTFKPISLSKTDLNDDKWLHKKSLALSKNIDFIPINLGNSKSDNRGWVLIDLKKSTTTPVYAHDLITIYRGDTFLKAINLLLNGNKETLLLILDEHNNLKGVLNKEDLTNLYFVSRVYTSLHVLEVLGLHAISLTPSGSQVSYNSVHPNSSPNGSSLPVTLLDILNELSSFMVLIPDNLYFKFNPSTNRAISHTNLSIYELRNNTMHPRVKGVTSFKIDKAFLRDFTYVEWAIIDLVNYCKNIMGAEDFSEWVVANI